MLLRARIVVPVVGPPLENGAVRVLASRLTFVGPWRDASPEGGEPQADLGEVILLPGLVNAHCHLDYTRMAGRLPPQRRFTDWIKLITAEKGGLSYADFAAAWLEGARQLLESGTTTVADIEAVPELLPEVWSASPLRVFSFLEMTGVKSRRNPAAILAEVEARILSLSPTRVGLGPSPHAPYSTTPRLLDLVAAASQRHRWLVCSHVAESAEEFEMFTSGRGMMFDWLARNERDNSDCGLGTPVQHLARHGLINRRFLAVHANYLLPADIEILASAGVSVVHCPRSHAYFQHAAFPLEALVAAGVNVCLGTDSLATTLLERGKTPRLDMFAEMRQFSRAYPGIPADTILRLATVQGAKALHLAGQVGELSPGALADLVAIPATSRLPDCGEAILNHTGPLAAGMIDGRWTIAPST